MNLGVNPGPLNEDVLFLSDTHRARALFTNTIPDNVQLNSNLSYSQTIANVVKCFRSQLTELHESMVDGVTQIYQMTGNLIGTYPENARKLEPLRDMAIGFMRIVNQISRLNYSTTHLTRNNVEFGGDTGPQRARRRTRTRARRQGDESNARAENFEVGEPSNPNQDYLPVFENETWI
ncbi:hypothetical protein R6Q59_012831 [Mikania micrantha]